MVWAEWQDVEMRGPLPHSEMQPGQGGHLHMVNLGLYIEPPIIHTNDAPKFGNAAHMGLLHHI